MILVMGLFFMNFQSWKVGKSEISLCRFVKLRINPDFLKFSNTHNCLVFEDMGLLFGILTYIYVFFEENFQKWPKNY